MKRKIAIALSLAAGIFLLSLIGFDRAAEAQNNARLTGDTGVVTLGQNQILRVTVSGLGGNDTVNLRFTRRYYSQNACTNGVCKLELNDEDHFGNIIIPPGEAVSMDIPNNGNGVRGVFSASKPVRANALIINTVTGRVEAIIAIFIA